MSETYNSVPGQQVLDEFANLQELIQPCRLAGLTPAEYTSLDWTYPDARPSQYIFYYPFRMLLSVGPNRRL